MKRYAIMNAKGQYLRKISFDARKDTFTKDLQKALVYPSKGSADDIVDDDEKAVPVDVVITLIKEDK